MTFLEQKIVSFLKKNPNGKSVSQIQKNTNSSYGTVWNVVRLLEAKGVLAGKNVNQKKKFKRARILWELKR